MLSFLEEDMHSDQGKTWSENTQNSANTDNMHIWFEAMQIYYSG